MDLELLSRQIQSPELEGTHSGTPTAVESSTRQLTPSMTIASSEVSDLSSGEPPKPTVRSHCDCSHDLHP